MLTFIRYFGVLAAGFWLLAGTTTGNDREAKPPHIPLDWEPDRRTTSKVIIDRNGRITGFRGGAVISRLGCESKGDSNGLNEMEKYILESTNKYRQARGLPPLKHDSKLTACARDHSSDMKNRRFFSHTSPIAGKARFTDRAIRFRTTASAENIARDCKNGESAMQLWLKSPGHLRNITGNYTRIGIGRRDGYYTQIFGQ